MSRDRFLLLLQFLHFSNNEAATPGDRLAKLRPLTDMMFGLFERLYTPHQFISIDQELVLFKGRLLFKQFIPSKRACFGLKIFALCDTHGYFYTASIYTSQPNPPLPHTDTLGATGAIVVHLMESLLDKGCHLYVDNWYTSINLASFLESRGTGLCGTMRANRRGIPQALMKSNCPKGTYAYRRKDSLQLVKLRDKKVVFLLSTIHDAGLVRTNKRNRQGQVIKRLRVNREYNSRMGVVDKNDAMVTSVSGLRKTLKWYIKVEMQFFRRPFKMPTSPTVSKVGGSNTTISFVKPSMSLSVTLKKPVSQRHTKHHRTGWLESTSFKRIRRQLSVKMLCGNVSFVRPVDFAENHATSARPAPTTLASVSTHATRSIILLGSTNSIVWRYLLVFSSSIFSLLKTDAIPRPISLFLSNCYTFRRLHELL